MTATTSLQDRLTAVILADPDVHTIYPPRATLRSRLPRDMGDRSQQPSNVVVSETTDGITVTVSVGVTGEHPAPFVCRNLHDRIATELASAGVSFPASIAVKIASIV